MVRSFSLEWGFSISWDFTHLSVRLASVPEKLPLLTREETKGLLRRGELGQALVERKAKEDVNLGLFHL